PAARHLLKSSDRVSANCGSSPQPATEVGSLTTLEMLLTKTNVRPSLKACVEYIGLDGGQTHHSEFVRECCAAQRNQRAVITRRLAAAPNESRPDTASVSRADG